MKFWTAQYRYPGPYRLDITAKGDDKLGKVFAPTWDMVKDYKAGFISEDVARERYVALYHDMMLASHTYHKAVWDEVLAEEYVVLVCFCASGAFCHRNLLAHYLVHYGAQYMGEIKNVKNYDLEMGIW